MSYNIIKDVILDQHNIKVKMYSMDIVLENGKNKHLKVKKLLTVYTKHVIQDTTLTWDIQFYINVVNQL